MKRWIRIALSLVAAATLAIIPRLADAERAQDGDVIVSLNGGVRPRMLPRHRRVPVAVHMAGRILTADHSQLPRVNWIRLELAWRGQLRTRGLAVCPVKRIRNSTNQQSIELCHRALVGHGRLFAKVFVPNQTPLGVNAHLTAFNGRTKGGAPRVLVHAYTPSPPVSFVIPFSVHHRRGNFRTVLIATIRRSVGPWPHVSNFQIYVSRTFRYHGRWDSYLSASCPIPKHFTAGFLSFARATYALSGGRKISAEAVRSCRAR